MSVMKQLLSAIAYCHSKGIVHRDLKPENLLVSSTKGEAITIKLIDFGSADYKDPTKKFSEKIGTPYYIAPEILKQSYDEKCDVWSCGIVMHTLLCGEPPFMGANDAETLKKVALGVVLYKRFLYSQ